MLTLKLSGNFVKLLIEGEVRRRGAFRAATKIFYWESKDE